MTKTNTINLIKEKWRGMSYPDTIHPSKLDDYDPKRTYQKGDTVTYKGKKRNIIYVHGNDAVDAVTGKRVNLKGHINIQEAEDAPVNYDKTSKVYIDAKGRKYRLTKDGKKYYWVNEGKIKELDTLEKEEKRLKKPVLTKDQRDSLQKLKDIAKYNAKKDKK